MSSTEPIIQAFADADQAQVFRFFEHLSDTDRKNLLDQARGIDLIQLSGLRQAFLDSSQGDPLDLDDLEPPEVVARPESGGDPAAWKAARAAGEEALRSGRVAAFIVAGGQGTRLGFDGPKGAFPVTPVRQATLFQVFAEKLIAARQRYQAPIPWFIMTSVLNHQQTVSFFEEHHWFGMSPDSVTLFRQGLMPAIDFEGQILLENPATIAMSPDGHGGSLKALVASGATEKMAAMGIDTISYFQVDNPLVHCVDPTFIGFHCLGNSEMTSKMLPKAYPEEKLGHFCRQRGQTRVIEYSDMPIDLCQARQPDGELRFRAGSIAVHLLDRQFVERLESSGAGLPFHRAKKKVTCLDQQGNTIVPEQPNAIKFERFVFDALPLARRPVIVECQRASEFSPVKNASGVDSADTCRRDQLRLFASWLRAVGHPLPVNQEGDPAITFEITPSFAETLETFQEKWAACQPKPTVVEGSVLQEFAK